MDKHAESRDLLNRLLVFMNQNPGNANDFMPLERERWEIERRKMVAKVEVFLRNNP